MKEEADELTQQKMYLYQQYFSTPRNFTQNFLSTLFSAIEQDPRTQSIFLKNLTTLLSSKHSHAENILEYCLQKQDKNYFNAVVSFLREYLNVSGKKNEIHLVVQRKIELYIIARIWEGKMKPYIQHCGYNNKKIIIYLSLKMRSLEAQTRKQALETFYNMIKASLEEDEKERKLTLGQILPKMIEKQTLVKKVSYHKGVLLQILEDQHHEIKTRCIELLGLAKQFFQIKTLQPLILYMLNDEHKSVRQTSLLVLRQIQPLNLEKEDLVALLMCLKEKNIQLRSYVYDNIPNINIKRIQDFETILDKLFQILIIYKVDKKSIYLTCGLLGRKYPEFVLQNLEKILNYKEEEPNWKNLIYKAKVILVANIGKNKWPTQALPVYFPKHYLYIRDMEHYAFERKETDEKAIWNDSEIKLDTGFQLKAFVNSQVKVRTGFAQDVLKVMKELLEKGLKESQAKIELYEKVEKIEIKYNVKKSAEGLEVIESVKELIRNDTFDQECLRNLLYFLKKDSLDKIPANIFHVSKDDPNCILISNNEEIFKKSFIEFSIGKETKYLRMSEVEFEDKDEDMCYYMINFKWKRLRCLIIYSNEPIQQYVTDEHKLGGG